MPVLQLKITEFTCKNFTKKIHLFTPSWLLKSVPEQLHHEVEMKVPLSSTSYNSNTFLLMCRKNILHMSLENPQHFTDQQYNFNAERANSQLNQSSSGGKNNQQN